MRGLVWSQMITMIIVIVVIIIMFQMFSFAFGQGTNVLKGGLDWIESKTGIGIGQGGSDVLSVSFRDDGVGRIGYVIDLPSRREYPMVVEFHIADKSPITVPIGTDDEDTVKTGTLTFEEPAVYVEAIVRQNTGSGDVLTREAGFAVNLRAFESGTAGDIVEGMVRGLTSDLVGSETNPRVRTDRALDVLKDHCNMPASCEAHYTQVSGGLTLENAKASARRVYDMCIEYNDPSNCPSTKAVLASWVYCTHGSDPASLRGAGITFDDYLSTTVISPSRCPVDSIEDSESCFETPFERSLSCDTSINTVWRYE